MDRVKDYHETIPHQESADIKLSNCKIHLTLSFYASAFRRRRHYVFGLSVRPSVRPSVRSLKYPLLTYTWVCWSTWPTVTVLRHVRPSVCPSVRPSGEVSGHLPETAWREWPEILHADVSWPSSELISLWPRSVDFYNFDLSKRVKFGVSGHFPENASRK